MEKKERKIKLATAECKIRRGKTVKIFHQPKKDKEGDVWHIQTTRKIKGKKFIIKNSITEETLSMLYDVIPKLRIKTLEMKKEEKR